ncbi:60S ribosomal protein L35a-1-like [Triticum dicoccoides]|uniref:60S ribosomal protein L35a-1-like n=1 Tax=Triticum dicoccoides TaxID=85692 RepID=UPI00188FE4B3|nr:60S ribosomal protein L35a-1-like [Triticum dicoccoides]
MVQRLQDPAEVIQIRHLSPCPLAALPPLSLSPRRLASPCRHTAHRLLHPHPTFSPPLPSPPVSPSRRNPKRRTGQRVRLYVRGTILGFKRSKSNQYESTSLVQVEGVNTKEDVAWYGGSKTSYIRSQRDDTHYRCLCGKITRPHDNSGVVRAQFKSNLPAESMVRRKVRVFMYPSII